MTIRLQFSRQAGIASAAIAWFSQSNFSHVDAVLPSGRLLGARHDKVGGKPSGVEIRPTGYAKFALAVQFVIPTTDEQANKFYHFLFDQIGKPYDSSAIWGFVTGRNWRAQDSWFCSELIAAALEHAGIFPPLYFAANKITPNALALVVSTKASSRNVLAGACEFKQGYAT